MREYIFYVLLIFLPIGAFMVKILLNYGLPKKNIAGIVLISLSIVITFPISIEKLGIWWTLVIYCGILFLVLRYVVKLDNHESSQTEEAVISLSGDSELFLEQQLNEAIKNKDDLMEVSAISLIQEETPVVSERETEDVKGDAREEIANTSIVKSTTDDIGVVTDLLSKEKVETNQAEITDNEEEVVIEPIPMLEEETVIEISEELRVMEIENSTDETIELSIKASIDNEEAIEPEENSKAHENKILAAPRKETEDLIAQLDLAFQYKNDGDINKTIEQFQLIWQNSRDNELKYLITMELVQLYKERGSYNLAQDILTNFHNEIQGRDDNITKEIYRELTFINLLIEEISRLQLDKVPLEKLPRWVKMKVAENLKRID